MDAAKSYQRLYTRLMDIRIPTKESLKHTFYDKELRVVMGMNKILIGDFRPDGVHPARSLYDQHYRGSLQIAGTYKEKSKDKKLESLMPMILARSLVAPGNPFSNFVSEARTSQQSAHRRVRSQRPSRLRSIERSSRFVATPGLLAKQQVPERTLSSCSCPGKDRKRRRTSL